ncbi:hypothetical protein ACHAPE_003863 [Trichoderma viride]
MDDKQPDKQLDKQLRSVSHNTFGDNNQIFQGDYNVSASRKTLDLDYLHEATFNGINKEEHTPLCLENTRVQVLGQIRRWIDGDGDKHVYWLRGMAGTGKTTISLTIAREYYEKKRLGASFFFSRGSSDLASTKRFVATIANQLAELLPAYREHLSKALESHPSISRRRVDDQWERLILDPLRLTTSDNDVTPILMIVDALDECESQYDMSVLVQCTSDLATLENIPFRIFITSRPEKAINSGFDSFLFNEHHNFNLHDIEESIVTKDLELYYKHELNSMDIDAFLITDNAIKILVRKSGGLFIHAATACRFIRQGEIYASARLSSFIASQGSNFESERELDSIYVTVLKNAFSKFADLKSDEMESLQVSLHKIVGSVVMLYDKISPSNLAIMIGESKENTIRLLKLLSSVLDVPEEASGQISVLHSSFRDFLLDPERSSGSEFSINSRKIHADLLEQCLDIMAQELRKDINRLRQPGTRTKDVSKVDVDSHISYVLQEHSGILEFFQTRFLFWIEVLALTGRLSDSIEMMRLLESLLAPDTQVDPAYSLDI